MNTKPKTKPFRIFWRESLVSGFRGYARNQKQLSICDGYCRIEALDEESAIKIFSTSFPTAEVLKIEPTI